MFKGLLSFSFLFLILILNMGADRQPMLSQRSVIWIGDSRCVGIKRSCQIRQEDFFIAEGEKSYRWFVDTALPRLRRILDKDPDQIVIIMIGFNDCFNQAYGAVESYTAYAPVINDLISQYPDTIFCFCSVNPVDDRYHFAMQFGKKNIAKDKDAINPIIETFNTYLKKNCRAYYMDSYHYLEDHGFETKDGIHYTKATYGSIYDFCLKELVHPITEVSMKHTLDYLKRISMESE